MSKKLPENIKNLDGGMYAAVQYQTEGNDITVKSLHAKKDLHEFLKAIREFVLEKDLKDKYYELFVRHSSNTLYHFKHGVNPKDNK